jgi:hypothetical protein
MTSTTSSTIATYAWQYLAARRPPSVSTNRTTMLTRTSQCLSAAVLMAGFAFWSTAIAGARPETLNEEDYKSCVAAGNPGVPYPDLVAQCCYMAGGEVGGTEGTVPYCDAPEIDPGCCTREDTVQTPQIVDAPDLSNPPTTINPTVPSPVHNPGLSPRG